MKKDGKTIMADIIERAKNITSEEIAEVFRKRQICKNGEKHKWKNVTHRCCPCHDLIGGEQSYRCTVCGATKRGHF